jgi:hypothetical protein
LKTLHKRLLLILVVVTPMYWLLFTEDGRRRSDTLLLWMAGGEPIDINFRALDAQYSLQDWQKVYADIDWHCGEQKSAFGDSLCYSEISSYNGIPARYLSAFFRDNHISAVKLVYRNLYHRQLGLDLQQQLGTPLEKTHDQPDNDVLQWHTPHGSVLIRKTLSKDEDASLLWLAK